MSQNTQVQKEALLPVRSLPAAVVPRNSHWTVDSKGIVKLMEVNGRLVSTGVKIGRRAVRY